MSITSEPCQVCSVEVTNPDKNLFIVFSDNGKQKLCRKCRDETSKGSINVCTICGKKSRIIDGPLTIVYCGEEEFRVCKGCKKIVIEGTRLLINGLRRNNGVASLIFKESRIEHGTSFATQSPVNKH